MRRLVKLWRGMSDSPQGGYLQFLAMLLLVAGALFTWMLFVGCNCSCDGGSSSNQQPADPPTTTPLITAYKAWALPGERVGRALSYSVPQPPGPPGDVTIAWYPPHGATNFSFSRPPGDTGGVSFQFYPVAPGEVIEVSFNMPVPSPSSACWQQSKSCPYHESVVTGWGGVMRDTAGFDSTVVETPPPLSESSLPARPRVGVPVGNGPRQVNAWEVQTWAEPRDVTMTTDLCQEWIDFMQDEGTFMAMRAPISSTVVTSSYPLPVLFGGKYSNTVQLIDVEGGSTVVTASLEYRLNQFHFAVNELPGVQDEAWFALGVSPEPITCPPGLEIPPNTWTVEGKVLLDLSHEPGNCEGCVLPSYMCYEGQAPPSLPTTLLARLLEPASGITYHDDWGVTCIGPNFVRLVESRTWELGGTGFRAITLTNTPPQTLTFPHYISCAGQTRDFDLTYSSTLDVSWGLFGGSWFEPDLGTPLTPPLTVTDLRYVWLVSAVVPTDTAAGPYQLVVTATALSEPTPPTWTKVDHIWVGGWIPPAPRPCTELTAVDLSGPASGRRGMPYAFLAQASPTTATTPLSYTWQAEGQTEQVHAFRGYTDTVAFTWDSAGSYQLTVTIGNECGTRAVASHTITIWCDIYLPLTLKSYARLPLSIWFPSRLRW